jgi:2-polyprenyl-3-methyl-5-hydroxy-6-metoxy-1,4-benzoquinol methylase
MGTSTYSRRQSVYKQNIQQRKGELEAQYGPWTAHNIQLADDVYTIDHKVVGDEYQLRRIMQIFSDISHKPLDQVRALDLACLEGLYAIELARRGAQVVGIEGREANIAKARFAKEVLGLNNLELICDDVRNLRKEKHGTFDVVLCSGILYHLDVPDVFDFLAHISEVCQGFAVIDTHVGPAEEEFTYKGKKYRGAHYDEHAPDATSDQIAKELWKSLTNRRSFWLTRASLYNLLAHLNFTSVYETHCPREVFPYETERINLVAIKGQPQQLLTAPLVNALPEHDWPEAAPARIHFTAAGARRLLKKLVWRT